MKKPIDCFEISTSDITIARVVVDAESASITGIDIERAGILQSHCFPGAIGSFHHGALSLGDGAFSSGKKKWPTQGRPFFQRFSSRPS